MFVFTILTHIVLFSNIFSICSNFNYALMYIEIDYCS